MNRDSVLGTVLVAAVLCVVSSVLVSGTAVGLRARQSDNKELFQRKNILLAAGLIEDAGKVSRSEIVELFKQIETQIIDLDTGERTEDVDASYDQRAASRDPKMSVDTQGLAGFSRRERFSRVYLVKQEEKISKVVLPVYGKGLWSTLYGYLAIEQDRNTVAGLTFYEHKETPGLGGEVDNPAWKAQWIGKKIRDAEGKIRLQVIKGKVDPVSPSAANEVDGLSGATITSRGVSNLVQYWMSEQGFGKYLQRLEQPVAN